MATDQARGRDVWSGTNLVAVGDADVEKVGKRSHDATNVLQHKGKGRVTTQGPPQAAHSG